MNLSEMEEKELVKRVVGLMKALMAADFITIDDVLHNELRLHRKLVEYWEKHV